MARLLTITVSPPGDYSVHHPAMGVKVWTQCGLLTRRETKAVFPGAEAWEPLQKKAPEESGAEKAKGYNALDAVKPLFAS